MKNSYYFCGHAEIRVPTRDGKVLCEHYRTSEIQTWCAMGRLPCDCDVENQIVRGEEPRLSDKAYVAELLKVCKQAQRRLLSFQRELARRPSIIELD